MKARETIVALVAENVAPVLKAAGFRKTGLTFHRRVNDVVQVVNIQLSTVNLEERGRFYINVGLNFDRVLALAGHLPDPKPPEIKCHARTRAESLVPVAPAQWNFATATEGLQLAGRLRRVTEQLALRLNDFDSIEAFVASDWTKGKRGILYSQLYLVLGDQEMATTCFLDGTSHFHADPGWDVDWLLDYWDLGAIRSEVHRTLGPRDSAAIQQRREQLAHWRADILAPRKKRSPEPPSRSAKLA